MSGNTIVQLCVGGQLYTTTAATLSSPAAAGSMLAKLVELHLSSGGGGVGGGSGKKRKSSSMQPTLVDPRHPDALFLDRDGQLFSYILDYLRNGGELVPPDDLCTTKRLLAEAQFYQLQEMAEQLEEHADSLEEERDEAAQQRAEQTDAVKAILSQVAEQAGAMQTMQSNMEELREYVCEPVPVSVVRTSGYNRTGLVHDLAELTERGY